LRLVADAWDYLYERWLPESDRDPHHLPSMKWFHRRPDELDWQSWDLDCAVPLEATR
jgi:DNA gyrase inhibitor GyrI